MGFGDLFIPAVCQPFIVLGVAMSYMKLDNVMLEYPLYGVRGNDLRQVLLRQLVGGVVDSHNKNVVVRALDNISLDIKSGTQILLVGHNGAGKSTLLKLMAGVYKPTQGSFRKQGRVISIFDLLYGMVFEATGRDNVLIRAASMGIPLAEARQKTDEIIAFSGLDSYIDMPIYSYSAGMLVRLGFSITTAFEADILLIDEVINAGDADFMHKATDRLKRLSREAAITIVASHALDTAAEFASHALWLEKGSVKAYGEVNGILADMKKASANK